MNPLQQGKTSQSSTEKLYTETMNEVLPSADSRFQAIARHSNTGIAECNLDGTILFANHRLIQMTGYLQVQMYDQDIRNLIHADDRQNFEEVLLQVTAIDDAIETELKMVSASGEAQRILLTATSLRNKSNTPVSFLFSVSPSRGQLQKSRDILESVTDAFFSVDQHWRFTYINKKAEQLNRRQPGDLIGKDLWKEFPALEGSEYGQLYRQVAKDRIAGTVTASSIVDGQWYEVHAFPAFDGIAAYFKNVTERVVAEEALRKSEDNLRTIFNTIDEGFCIIEMIFDNNNQPVDYRFLEYNRMFEVMTGLQDAIGKTILQLLPAD